jgi:ribulose-5-phosphate 4-epimerase/fuculose-1-phosphate aldolase
MLGCDKITLPDNYAALHNIPIVPWRKPGSWELAYGNLEALHSLPKDKFVVMGLHGPFSMGKDLDDAYMVMQKMENTAQMAYLYNTYTAAVK